MPSALQFTEGYTSEYLYDTAGVKRKVKQVTTTENLFVPMGSMLPVPAIRKGDEENRNNIE